MFKKQDKFFDMLVQVTENISEAAIEFQRGVQKYEGGEKLFHTIKAYEDKGDLTTHQIIRALNAAYMTPIEREDILSLATTMDDVLDGIETASSRFDLFNIAAPDQFVLDFAVIIVDCAEQLQLALKALQSRKMLEIRQYTVKINELENVGDKLYRDAVKSLFSRTNDPIEIMKIKEVYEVLEHVTDCYEDAADILESIVMTNA